MQKKHVGIYILSGIVLSLVLLTVTLVREEPPFWDEEYYLENILLLEQYGLSKQFLDNYKGPAGPTFAFVHYILQPITKMQSPAVRLVNIFLLACTLVFLYLCFRKLNFSSLSSAAFTFSSMAIPTIYTISGMALTEIPAVFFLSICLYLIISHYISNKNNYLLAILTGLVFSLAILGRQPIILICLAIPVFFINPGRLYKIDIAKKEFLKFITTAIIVSLIIPFYIFYVWGNIQPESQALTGVGLAPVHLVLALGYTAIFTLLVNPHFFNVRDLLSGKIELATVIVSSVLLNLLVLKVEFTPFHTIATTHLSPELLQLYQFSLGSLLAILGFTFIYYFVKKQLLEKDQLTLFLTLGFLLIVATSIKVTHQFSARYVVQAFPMLVLAANLKREKVNWISIVALVTGGVLGLVSLESYFQ